MNKGNSTESPGIPNSGQNEQLQMLINTSRHLVQCAIIEQSRDGIMVTDENGNIDIWNKGMELITGINRCDAVGLPAWQVQLQLFPDTMKTPQLIEQVKARVKNILESKQEWKGQESEQEIQCADGTTKYIQTSAFTIKYEETVRLETIVRDITERKKAEEALLFKENVIRHSSCAIATSDLEGNMTFGNPAFIKIWGFAEPGEFLGRPFWELWLLEERRDEIMQVLQSEGHWSGATRARRKDGTIFEVHVSAATVFNSAGKPVALTSTSIDITERKREQDALRIKDWAIESAVNAFVTTDMAGNMNYVNSAFINLVGCNSPLEVLGKPVWGFCPNIEVVAKVKASLLTEGFWKGGCGCPAQGWFLPGYPYGGQRGG